jgi:adenylate kinase
MMLLSIVIILLGPPGSGKGTQAIEISKHKNVPHISTGDLFRENIGNNTELGKEAKSFMDQGRLVPDDLVLNMLFDRVSRPDCKNGYVLDGFPRTIPQAEALDRFLKDKSKVIALNLDVPDDVIIKRIEGRLTCKTCGNMYHKDFSPPVEEGICDKCGSPLIQRADDTREVVMERLRVYKEQTAPLIQYYEKQGVLKTVDGNRPPKVVLDELLKYGSP